MNRQSHPRFRWLRLAVGVFALCLMVVTALHTPVGVLVASGQHTASSFVDHGKQPCLDSPGFDWTVPQSRFSPVFQPRRAQHSLGINRIAYSPRSDEFRLYNRPPPLS